MRLRRGSRPLRSGRLDLVRSARGTDAAADTCLSGAMRNLEDLASDPATETKSARFGKRGTDSLTTTNAGTLAPRRRGNRAAPGGVV